MFYINENTDVFKLSNSKEVENQIAASVYSRLCDWGEYKWLGDDDEEVEGKTKPERLKSCFEKFYYYIGKKKVPPGIKNWECGLGQILGGLDDKAESVLPYILTAYMYNFADFNGSRFVSVFLENCEKYGINLNKFDSLRDDLFGCTQPEQNQYPSQGIGCLITSQTPKNAGRFIRQLQKFANQFVLKDLAWMSTVGIGVLSHPKYIDANTVCNLCMDYIVPTDRYRSWCSGLALREERTASGEEPKYVDIFISYKGERSYAWTGWWEIFLTWYHVLRKDYVLDPIACLFLLNSAVVQVNQGSACESIEKSAPILKINTVFDDGIKKGEIEQLRKEMGQELEDEFHRRQDSSTVVPGRFTRIYDKRDKRITAHDEVTE